MSQNRIDFGLAGQAKDDPDILMGSNSLTQTRPESKFFELNFCAGTIFNCPSLVQLFLMNSYSYYCYDFFFKLSVLKWLYIFNLLCLMFALYDSENTSAPT